ncbi:MAG: hypothetical protein KJO77_00970 [Bacteroidia bacterium]|nr:hypothetical protein [Bacteroidia bacterium]NND52991.1 hypothetical protein [Flavobacteriaceae bacterium]
MLSSLSCDTGNLTVIADLPSTLKEVSGTEIVKGSELIWMLNDGGNKPRLYGLSRQGKIVKELKIDAKNNDWEDLTTDDSGNIYIGDFGNNLSERKNLAILKVAVSHLDSEAKVPIERISFKYPNQKKYPPKKKQLYFDCESFFFYNDSLYLFTKSRVKGDFGRTDLYKIPAKRGQHVATYIDSFTSCSDLECWITSADISEDGKKVILLNHKSVWVFSDFVGDDFLSGTANEYPFEHESQKEAVCFIDQNTIYITDERAHGAGGNLYRFNLN